MFDLEQATADWRRQMIASGIKSSDALDELESHLREDVERQMRFGATAKPAFEQAVRSVGPAHRLKAEFAQVENTERKYMKRILIFIAGFIGIMVGMALVMPAVAQYRHEGAMRNGEPWLFLIGSLFTLAGGGAAVRGLKKRRA